MAIKTRNIFLLISLFFQYSLFGGMYLNFSLILYNVSYLYQYDNSASIAFEQRYKSILELIITIMTPLMTYVAIKYPPKLVFLLGGAIYHSKYIIITLVQEKYQWYFFETFLASVGGALVLYSLVKIMKENFPDNKATYFAILAGSSSLTGSLFQQVTNKNMNPHNLKPSIIVQHGEEKDRYYDHDVLQNFSQTYITQFFLSGGIFLVGYCLFAFNPYIKLKNQNQQQKGDWTKTKMYFTQSRTYYFIITSILLIFIPSQIFTNQKIVLSFYDLDDKLLTRIISAIGIINIFGKILLGQLLDRIKYFRFFLFQATLILIGQTLLQFFIEDTFTFGIICGISQLVIASNVTLLSLVAMDLFKLEGLYIYNVMNSGMMIFNLIFSNLQASLQYDIGFRNYMKIILGLSIVLFGLIFQFKRKQDIYDQKDEENRDLYDQQDLLNQNNDTLEEKLV